MKLSLRVCATIILLFSIACTKFLDKVPDKSLAIPTSLNDFQEILDNSNMTSASAAGVLDLGCDDYYLSPSIFTSLGPQIQNSYTWASDIWQSAPSGDWNSLYAIIYNSNVVLEGLENFKAKNNIDTSTWNKLYGQALFIRGIEHYFLEETFGQPYRINSNDTDLGIPLRLSSNLAAKAVRSSVKKVYSQIISDLLRAKDLLPATNSPISRPSKAATFAMLARVHLTMQDYQNAGAYADSSLQIKNTLYDFKNLANPNAANPFPLAPNDFIEILYPSLQYNYGLLRLTTSNVDSILYQSYDTNDLRKSVFFGKNTSTNTNYFKGFLTGTGLRPFSGPAVDEMYLIRAEASARAGNATNAMNDLNSLLSKRWKGVFTPLNATDPDDALKKVLIERRKELVIRGLRWIDLRRLNQDSKYAITLKRVLSNQVYTLIPTDPKYTYPIPQNEIQLSGIQQNLR